MSGIPNEISKLGDVKQKPRQNPEFVPGAGFGTDDYFVWSRCDGTVSLRDVILMVGFGIERSIGILMKLRSLGAVLMPGESKPPAHVGTPDSLLAAAPPPAALPKVTAAAPPPAALPKVTAAAPPAAAPPPAALPKVTAAAPPAAASPPASPLPNPSAEEQEALTLDLELAQDIRIRIMQVRRKVGRVTLFELLELDITDADRPNVKRAYFRLSKEFHPDRHYGKDLGPFNAWLSEVFKAVTAAFNILGNKKKRSRYEASLRGESSEAQPQSKEEHAKALYESACEAEIQGQSEQALKLFAASLRMDEQPRVLRRASMCAVQAAELSVAEEYAKKAAELCGKQPSYLRTLADVYRAGNRFIEAKEVLERALLLDTENDVLFTEMQADLESVEASLEKLGNA